jgi:hypothetical protein
MQLRWNCFDGRDSAMTIRGCRRLLRPLVAVVVAGLAWLAVEAGAWCVLRLAPVTGPIGRWEFRGAQPAPYADAPYFGPEFLDESLRCVRLSNPPDTSYLVAGDFQGRFIRVADGRRRTTDQPESFDHRVLLFGGSTVFNQEVPDEHTLASCLQRVLHRQASARYRVENHGAPAMIARQQTERLAHTPLRPGDVVVFYDGVNDVYYPVYNGNPAGYRLGDDSDGGVRKLSGGQALLYPLCFRLKEHSAVAALLFHRIDGPRPANLVDADTLSGHLDAAEAGYLKALTDARSMAEERGARFVHLLQPHLFSLGRPTRYERAVIRNELQALPGLDEAYRLGYPRLRQATATAAGAGVVTLDMSGILDVRENDEEYYFDFCHVNHTANDRLARAIAAQLTGLSPSP